MSMTQELANALNVAYHKGRGVLPCCEFMATTQPDGIRLEILLTDDDRKRVLCATQAEAIALLDQLNTEAIGFFLTMFKRLGQ